MKMPYCCPNCGETSAFYADEYGRCHYSVRVDLDADGEHVDSGEFEYDDFDGDREGICCSSCDSTPEDIPDEVWARIDQGDLDYEQYFEEGIEEIGPVDWKKKITGK